MNTMEAVFTKILNCGTLDLQLLNDIDYDLDDIIDDCMMNDDLSLHGIFRGVFCQGARDFQLAWEQNKEEIRENILAALEEERLDVENGEITQEELEGFPEHQELVADMALLESDTLHPEEDMNYFLNYLDTHVQMRHIDFYRRWMESDVEEIESNMGWTFEDCWM